LPFSTLKVSFPVLENPANNHRAVPLTPEQFHYAFTNDLSEEESLKAYRQGKRAGFNVSGVVLDGIGKQGIGFARKTPRDADNENLEWARVTPETVPSNFRNTFCRGCDHLRFRLDVRRASPGPSGGARLQ
jgi:hypothetical protein